MQPEWQHIFMTREIVPQTVPPRLPMWMLPKLYSQACAVDCHYLHISFSSQMIRFSSSRTCGTWPYSPFFVCHPFFISCHFFLFARKCFMWQILSSMQKLNSKACIHVKFSSCTIWKVPYQKTYVYTKNFLWVGVLPHIVCLTCAMLCPSAFTPECF
jgi:hypothetical protein